MNWRILTLTALAAFMVDQSSKYWVVHVLSLRTVGQIEVWPPFLNFHMAWNRGINFGLLPAESDWGRYVLIVVSLAICAFVLRWVVKEAAGRFALFSAGLLIGGALGNVIDRIIYGAVADFLNMSCCGIDNPFAFNVADAAIFAGAIGLIFATGDKKQA